MGKLRFPLGVCDFSFITVIKEKSQTPKGNLNLRILEAGAPTSKNSREQLSEIRKVGSLPLDECDWH